MLESPAWAAMPLAARKVVDRILIEHMKHAGTENGNLIVTHSDFCAYGIRRASLTNAISIAVDLGFINRMVRGRLHGDLKIPSRYRLTWLPSGDWQASNRWKTITTERAEEVLAKFKGGRAISTHGR
jgi:hypothetical protein